MKHLKLYEGFDEEEAWWDEKDPFGEEIKPYFDNKEFMIVQRIYNNFYYIAKIEGENMIRWKNEPYSNSIENYRYPAHPQHFDKIFIYDKYNEYRGYKSYYPWKYFYYGELPEELKNKIKK